MKWENVLLSDLQTFICVCTRTNSKSNQKLPLDWVLSNPSILVSPNEENVTTQKSSLQIDGTWLKVFFRWPTICLPTVYTPLTVCIFQVTQEDTNYRLWVSPQHWGNQEGFQPSFNSSNLCCPFLGMNLTAARWCMITSPTDPNLLLFFVTSSDLVIWGHFVLPSLLGLGEDSLEDLHWVIVLWCECGWRCWLRSTSGAAGEVTNWWLVCWVCGV